MVLQIIVRRLRGSRNEAVFRSQYGIVGASLLVLADLFYRYGIYLNRSMEEGNARKNYLVEYEPRRNRLTHDLIYEEFEMVLEDWVKLQTEYDASNCLIKVDGGKLVS